MYRKLFAWFMTLTMLLSLLPATGLTASAATTTKEVTFDFANTSTRPAISSNKISQTVDGITLDISDDSTYYKDGRLYMWGNNSSLKISCASERKMTYIKFYLYSFYGSYKGFQHVTNGSNNYTGAILKWNNGNLEWYESETGFTSLNLSCGSSTNSPQITKIVVTYQDVTPTDPIQSRSATAAKTDWETGPVKFYFKNKGTVTLKGDSIDKVIDRLYGSGTWSKLGDSSLSMNFQFSGIPSGEALQSVTVGQQ